MLLSECRITHRQPSEQPEVCRRFTEDPCCRRSSDRFPPLCNDLSLSSAVLARMLNNLVSARLITVGTEQQTHRDVVEVAHEALIREWPLLRGWVSEDRED